MIESDFSYRLHTFLETQTKLKNLSLKRLVVAYSGGVDSSVLLHLSKKFIEQQGSSHSGFENLSLLAIHVNHGLSEQAENWAKHCQTTCDSLACQLVIKSVSINTGGAIEEQARSKRYQVFSNICEAGDVLLTAHHLNDQSETLLFRFLRGAGSNGLQGMPEFRYLNNSSPAADRNFIYRPLLGSSKATIHDYAKCNNLTWVEDGSNAETTFSRNFIRKNILPLLRSRWPELDNNLSRSAKFFTENEILLSDLAQLDLKNCFNNKSNLLKWGDSVDLILFCELSQERQKNSLRYWIKQSDSHLPNEKRLLNLLGFCQGYEREGAGEVSWYDGNKHLVFRVFESHLFFHCYEKKVIADHESISQMEEQGLIASESRPLVWYYEDQPEIVWQGYRYKIQETAFPNHEESTEGLSLSANTLEIISRQGGERCLPIGRQHSQTLKKLFQEYRIPPWERDNAPIFYHNAEIIAVADFWLCQESRESKDTLLLYDKASYTDKAVNAEQDTKHETMSQTTSESILQSKKKWIITRKRIV